MKPTVLFLFNHSTYALQPWIDDGRFNVVTVDYSDTDHSAFHATEDRFGQAFVRLNVDLSQPDAFRRVNTLLQYGLGFACLLWLCRLLLVLIWLCLVRLTLSASAYVIHSSKTRQWHRLVWPRLGACLTRSRTP